MAERELLRALAVGPARPRGLVRGARASLRRPPRRRRRRRRSRGLERRAQRGVDEGRISATAELCSARRRRARLAEKGEVVGVARAAAAAPPSSGRGPRRRLLAHRRAPRRVHPTGRRRQRHRSAPSSAAASATAASGWSVREQQREQALKLAAAAAAVEGCRRRLGERLDEMAPSRASATASAAPASPNAAAPPSVSPLAASTAGAPSRPTSAARPQRLQQRRRRLRLDSSKLSTPRASSRSAADAALDAAVRRRRRVDERRAARPHAGRLGQRAVGAHATAPRAHAAQRRRRVGIRRQTRRLEEGARRASPRPAAPPPPRARRRRRRAASASSTSSCAARDVAVSSTSAGSSAWPPSPPPPPRAAGDGTGVAAQIITKGPAPQGGGAQRAAPTTPAAGRTRATGRVAPGAPPSRPAGAGVVGEANGATRSPRRSSAVRGARGGRCSPAASWRARHAGWAACGLRRGRRGQPARHASGISQLPFHGVPSSPERRAVPAILCSAPRRCAAAAPRAAHRHRRCARSACDAFAPCKNAPTTRTRAARSGDGEWPCAGCRRRLVPRDSRPRRGAAHEPVLIACIAMLASGASAMASRRGGRLAGARTQPPR